MAAAVPGRGMHASYFVQYLCRLVVKPYGYVTSVDEEPARLCFAGEVCSPLHVSFVVEVMEIHVNKNTRHNLAFCNGYCIHHGLYGWPQYTL